MISSDPHRRRLVTRRGLVRGGGALALTGAVGAAWGFGIEPMSLGIVQHRIAPIGPWSTGLRLRIACLSDIHASEPYMGVDRIRTIADRTNALGADLVVLLGDYEAGSRIVSGKVPSAAWAAALSGLKAPLGVFAILGNHDWWEDRMAQRTGALPIAAKVLTDVGIRVLHNEAVALRVGNDTLWLAGLGDQLAFLPAVRRGWRPRVGAHDLAATLAAIPKGAPTILLAHEPNIFPHVPSDVALTLSGHTHGGQVRLFGWSPVVNAPQRYAWGHVREQADIVISGGLGYSILPVRFGMPPEITLVEVGATDPVHKGAAGV